MPTPLTEFSRAIPKFPGPFPDPAPRTEKGDLIWVDGKRYRSERVYNSVSRVLPEVSILELNSDVLWPGRATAGMNIPERYK